MAAEQGCKKVACDESLKLFSSIGLAAGISDGEALAGRSVMSAG
jgi:hypothetical protein